MTFTFEDFDLASLDTINMRPIEDGIIIEDLRTQARVYLARTIDDPREARPEDYLVRYLIERNEIDYDAHAALLYKLAGQVVARVKSYLPDDAEVENVLLRHGRQLADFIFAQMMNHYRETPLGEDDYEVTVTRGFMLLQAQPMNVPAGQRVRDFQAGRRTAVRYAQACLRRLQEMLLSAPEVRHRPRTAHRRHHRRRRQRSRNGSSPAAISSASTTAPAKLTSRISWSKPRPEC